jgi:transketolase
MMGVAAGIASCGEKVVASTFAMFAAGRAYEQVRTSIAYAEQDVIVVGTHGGVLIGEDGATHQCIEDISLMRTVPNMKVIVPCDGVQTKYALKYALENRGPMYLRLGRLDIPYVYEEGDEKSFQFGKANVLSEGIDITIAAVGEMVYPAFEASRKIKEQAYLLVYWICVP